MNEVAIINNQRKEIDTRRELSQYTELMQCLSNVERKIYNASVNKLVSEMQLQELASALGKMLKYIAIDVGANINDNSTWQYTQTRITTITYENYGYLSVQEIKTAFDLLVTGGLDDYLPKDRYGRAERTCYNNFNVSYYCKILEAYAQVRRHAIGKVYEKQEEKQKAITQKQTNQVVNAYAVMKTKAVFYAYKYRGKLADDRLSEMMIWQTLQGFGMVSEPKVTEADRKKALWEFRRKVQERVINKEQAHFVNREGTKSKELDFPAKQIAKRREIKEVFDEMIKEEYTIWN